MHSSKLTWLDMQILLNKGDQADAIPGLEIKTNEDKNYAFCMVSQIDEEQIFYLMCKADRKSAKREIIKRVCRTSMSKNGSIYSCLDKLSV